MNGLGQYKFSPLNNTQNNVCDVVFELRMYYFMKQLLVMQKKKAQPKTTSKNTLLAQKKE